MTKHFIGMVGALLGALAGGWLMVAPFALAYQPEGANWADPTFTDFWTGLALVIISLVGLIAYGSGLIEELRERGIMRRRVYENAAPGADEAQHSTQQGDLQQTLAPLISALLADLQEQQRRHQEEAGRIEPHDVPGEVQSSKHADSYKQPSQIRSSTQ